MPTVMKQKVSTFGFFTSNYVVITFQYRVVLLLVWGVVLTPLILLSYSETTPPFKGKKIKLYIIFFVFGQ